MPKRTLCLAVAAILLASEPSYAEGTQPPAAVTSVSGFADAIAAAKASMMADPAAALGHAQRAEAAASAQPDGSDKEIQLATAHWLQAEALIRLNRPREAEPIIKQALDVIRQIQPGSKLNGDLLMTRASLAGVLGDVRVALQTYHEAHNVYQAIGEDRGRAIALQDIGSIYGDAGDYERVLHYYAQSAEAYSGDPALDLSTYNNRGFAYLELERFGEAEAEFKKAVALAQAQDSAILEVRILTNIALAQLGGSELDEAEATIAAAFQRAKGSTEGWEPFLWGVRARIAFARHNLSAAGTYIGRTFASVDLAVTTMPFRDFHETAFQVYEALGNTTLALDHLKAFKRLDDEARNVAASTNSALAAAQFDFANQELNITKLKAGQLERDVALAAWNSRFLYSLLTAAAALLSISIVAFFWIRRSRNETRAANGQLSILNTDLEKALQARNRFLAMTSHEMRTPLNGILGMTQVMLANTALQSEVRDQVELVHSAGHGMRALVDDILDVAKMESGSLTLEDREFDLRALLDTVVGLWRSEAAARQIGLAIDLKACPQWVRGDEQRVRQIAYNLMSNAIKFTERGEVSLRAAVIERDGRQRICIQVRDTGVGIPLDKQKVIFEAFQQADAGMTRRFGGTGLGLSICQSLAEAMDGQISVDSTPGVGSTFTVHIALGILPASHAAPGVADADETGHKLLMILGNPLTQAVLKSKLDPHFPVVHALDAVPADGDDFTGFQSILVDAETVGGTADYLAEAMQRLRAHCPQARITVLLPEAADAALQAAADAAADQCVKRPIKADRLVSILSEPTSLHGIGVAAQ